MMNWTTSSQVIGSHYSNGGNPNEQNHSHKRSGNSNLHYSNSKNPSMASGMNHTASLTPEAIKVTGDFKRMIEKEPHVSKALFHPNGMPVKLLHYPPIPNWFIIQSALQKAAFKENFKDSLKSIILGYCKVPRDVCNFNVIHDPELTSLFAKHLPAIARHALKLPERLGTHIPLLKTGECRTLYLSRNLACSLIAHAMLCTITKWNRMDGLNSDFNFLRLYHETSDVQKTKLKKEKLKCFLEYFNQMGKMPESEGHSIISFERRCVRKHADWSKCEISLCDVSVKSGGRIEEATDMLQVDFANREIGGGVLGSGAVQEEIRFCISPELLCAMLFSEPLGHDEVMVMMGTKIFCTYTGYGSTFKFQKLRNDVWSQDKEKDRLGRGSTQVVAMDAWNYKPDDKMTQYKVDKIKRDLHKSYVGFLQGHRNIPVATGLWGCGYFNGDVQLKFIIQWMAASVNDRPFLKFYVSDDNTERRIRQIKDLLRNNGFTVATLYKIICDYGSDDLRQSGAFAKNMQVPLFDYVEKCVDFRLRKPRKLALSSLLPSL